MASPRGDGQYIIINAVIGKEAHLEFLFFFYNLCEYDHAAGSGGGLAAKSCPVHVAPWTVACQALLSMEFSSQ